MESKIEWIKLDTDDYETIIRTILEEIERIVDKSFNILDVIKKKREFDLHEYWSTFKVNPPRKSLTAKKGTSNDKKSIFCKLNDLEKIKLIEKASSKLQTNDLLRSNEKVSF